MLIANISIISYKIYSVEIYILSIKQLFLPFRLLTEFSFSPFIAPLLIDISMLCEYVSYGVNEKKGRVVNKKCLSKHR